MIQRQRRLVRDILALLPGPSERPLSRMEKYGFAQALAYIMDMDYVVDLEDTAVEKIIRVARAYDRACSERFD